jgi:DNA polymerase-3 subunit beta
VKLTCTKENLHQGLALVSHVSGKNANLPILNNVLLRTEVSGLKLTATNLDMTVTCQVRGKVDQPGEYTLPARLLADYISLLPDDNIELDLLDASLSIVCGKAKTKINGLPSSDFPLVPAVTGGHIFQVNAAGLDRALGQTLFAVSTSEARQILTGVSLEFNGSKKELVVAATDSYRLGEKLVTLSQDALGDRRLVVPARALGEIRRIISAIRAGVDAPELITVEMTENQVAFRYGPVELMTRTIDGVYPDYRQIIPKTFSTEFIVAKADLAQAVKRAALFSKQGLFDVRFDFKPDSGEIVLSSTDIGRGEHTVAVTGKGTGSENGVTLNYRYVLDGLSAIESDEVILKIIDAMNPCLMLPIDQQDHYLYIVMPIRQ